MPPDNVKVGVVAGIFEASKVNILEWLEKKPTGTFILTVEVNEGGIRGKPKLTKTQNL